MKKELIVQGDSDSSPAVPQGCNNESETPFCMTAIPAPAHRIERNRAAPAPAFVPRVMSSRLLVGNSGGISLLGGISRSAVGSPLRSFTCHSKGLFYENRTFSSVGNLFLLPLHRMFLSAPCKGTGNSRAGQLHPHNFRQIL